MAEELDRAVIKRVQRRRVAHINVCHDADAGLRLRITNAAQFFDDLGAGFLQLGGTSGAQQNATAGNREVTAQLQTDAQAAAGNDCGFAFVEPG